MTNDTWIKASVVLAATTFIGFQAWLAVSAIEDSKVNARVDENREQRIEADQGLRRDVDELKVQAEQLRTTIERLQDQLSEHRVSDAADDRGDR